MADEVAEERLNNDEFRELVPYLQLEDLFIVEIKYEDWLNMFESVSVKSNEHIRCNLCEDKPVLQIQAFESHLKEESHKVALNGVNLFYHPVYTYPKNCELLAKGETVSKEETDAAIDAAKKDLENQSKLQLFESKRLASLVQKCSQQKVIPLFLKDLMEITCFTGYKKFPLISYGRLSVLRCVLCEDDKIEDLNSHFQDNKHIKKVLDLHSLVLETHPEVNKHVLIQPQYSDEYEQALLKIVDKKHPTAPHMMRIVCNMTLDDLLQIEYMKGPVNRKRMLVKLTQKANSALVCKLCSGKTFCVSDANVHLNGKPHKKLQLETRELRHKSFADIKKHWILRIGAEYNVQISLKARKSHHLEVLRELKKLKKLTQDNMEASESCEATKQNKVGNGSPSNEKSGEGLEDMMEECNDEMDDELNKSNNECHPEFLEADHKEDLESLSNACGLKSSEVVSDGLESSEAEPTAGLETIDLINSKPVELLELSEKVAAKVKTLNTAQKAETPHVGNTSNTEKFKIKSSVTENQIRAEEALVGVEYVVKIMKGPKDQTPLYECCLCEVLMNESRMQHHLIGYNHRYKYCEMHYSNAFKKYSELFNGMKYYDKFRGLEPILEKLALEIEKYHGRSIPHCVMADAFKIDRPQVIARLYCAKHASQLFGPSLTNLFSNEDIQKLIAKKDNQKYYENSSKINKNKKNIECRFVEVSKGQLYCRQKVRVANVINIESQKRRDDRVVEFRHRSRSLSPKLRERVHLKNSPVSSLTKTRSRSSLMYEDQNQHIWQKYRQQILISASEVERAYIEYRKNPDSHPLYDQEWNRFWKQRKDELILQGINHRSHNFQQEWVPYFKHRLEELFGEALQQAKLDVRIRLNIPLNAQEDSDSNTHFRNDATSPTQHCFEDVRRSRSGNHNRSEGSPRTEQSRPGPPPKKQRVNTDDLVMQWNSQTKRDKNLSLDKWSNCLNNKESDSFSGNFRASDDKPDLIHVLRLMTAFEDYLGSLGPKITNLLYMTLSMEKTIQKNITLLEQKVLTPDNCSLLETAMEKLKGILFAGLLDNGKEPGFNQVIKLTTDLLNHADEMGFRKQLSCYVDKTHNQLFEGSNYQHLSNFLDNSKLVGYNTMNSKGFTSNNDKNTFNSFESGNHEEFRNQSLNSRPEPLNFFSHGGNNFHKTRLENGKNTSYSNINAKTSALNAVTQGQFVNNFLGSNGNFFNPQMNQRKNNLQDFGRSVASNLNMAYVRNHYNSNLNNNNTNSSSMADSGLTGNWKMNTGITFPQNSNKGMWQQMNTNNTHSFGGISSGMHQKEFKQLNRNQSRQN